MKAVVFRAYGKPEEVLKLEEIPTPVCGDNEVLVKIKARSVNPSDLYTIMGLYGVKPKLPAIPGNEAAGVVEEVGKNVKDFSVGDRVTLTIGSAGSLGTWKEYTAVTPDQIMKTPEGLSDEEATSVWANYLTSWILAVDELKIKPGEQLLVTAASSHLGRAMIQISRILGFKVVGTVRKEEQKQELLDMGAEDVIVTDTENFIKRARKITNVKGFPYAIDAVGGKIGNEAMQSLAPKGTIIVYGLMSNEPIIVPGSIIFTEITIRGFWLMKWMQNTTKEQKEKSTKELIKLFEEKKLVSQIDSRFDLADIQGYLQRSNTPGRTGKVIITSN